MLRAWYEKGIDDGETFRRRMKWALVMHVLAQVCLVVVIATRYSP